MLSTAIAGEVTLGDPDPARVAYWEKLLPEKPVGLGPKISDRAAWKEIGERPEFATKVADAEKTVSGIDSATDR